MNRLSYLVGVTSSPRPKPTLPSTLDSLAKSGWTDAIVFYDAERRGPWWNFKRALTTLASIGRAVTSPHGEPDCLLIAEDDIEITPGLRWWIDKTFANLINDGNSILSLYCPQSLYCGNGDPGWYGTTENDRMSCGALAYLIPFRTAFSLPFPDPLQCDQATDRQVAKWCSQNTGPIYFVHSPSFVRHIGGGNSSLRNPCGDDSTRQCSEFVTRIRDDGTFETVSCCD